MAYTKGFDHDIFISFSHEDTLALAGEKGWVAQYRESLEIWLRRRGLKGLSVWWDEEKLRGNTEFDIRIEDSLAKTALSVVLHSRNYGFSDNSFGRAGILSCLLSARDCRPTPKSFSGKLYRQSEYCRKELDWFLTHAQRHPLGLIIGDTRRILNVLIDTYRKGWCCDCSGSIS